MKLTAPGILFLISLIPFWASAQIPVYNNYTTKNGLPSDNVYSVMQDHEGFIWFSTDNGVSRFDGTQFKNFSLSDSLSSLDILRTIEDSKKRIWFLAFNGKLSFYLDGKIYNKNNSELIRKMDLKGEISYFFEDSKGNIWVCSLIVGLLKVTPSGEVKHYHFAIKYLWENKKGEVQAMAGQLIVKFNDTGFISSDIRFQYTFGVFIGENKLILSTLNGVRDYHLESKTQDSLSVETTNSKITGLSSDHKNNLWISTLSGVIKYDSSVIKPQNRHLYLNTYSINSVFQDSRGNYWFASFGSGVFLIPSLDIKLYDKSIGLSENNISALCEINDNQLLVGMHNGTIQLIDKEGVEKYKQTIPGSILKIEKDIRGNIWVLTDVAVFRYNNGKLTLVDDDNTRWYKTITAFKDGNVFIGKGRGVGKIENNKIKTVYWNGYFSRVYAIAEVNKDDLWLGTGKGLFECRNGKLIPPDTKNQILSHEIKSLQFSPDSTLWAGTESDGLVSIKGKNIKTYSTANGLSSNHCNMLLADSGKVYEATDKGLNLIETKNETTSITSYSAENGLISNHIYQILRKDSYVLLLATDLGVIEFDERAALKPATGLPYINEVAVNDHPVSLSGALNLRYNENSIRVDFGNINFNTDGHTKFRYRLVGADSGWNYTSTYSVKYSYLPPGNYKFVVSVRNADRSWSSNEASFQFYIQTPWWNTWLFRTIAVIVITLIISLIIKWRLDEYKQKLNQQRAVLESELKALRAQINPHFIFNSLNSIQDFIMLNQKEDAHLYLSKFATLMRGILVHSREQQISLSDEIQSLELYLELEALRFNNRFTFHFFVDEHIDAEETNIPSMVLQPYVENAILHGLAPIKKDGRIVISFRRENDFLVSVIEDNGIGRKKAAEKREQRVWKSHKSVGMQVTQERLDMMSIYQKDRINLEVEDLEDKQGNSLGTRVVIYFPFV